MAGPGTLPKPASQRARRNRDTGQVTTLRFERGVQPALPEGVDWPEATIAWWRRWGESPMAEHFMDVDWSYLLDTALLHKKLWERESTEAAKEVRLRVEAFGATVAARLRLKMQFAEVEDSDARRGVADTEKDCYGGLRAVD